jgi:hypothetical protein
MASWQGLVALGTCLISVGCSAEKAPDSTIETGGSGGMAGSAGSFILGNGGSTAGAGGSAPLDTGPPPTITFHTCGMPEPSCDPKLLTGDVVIDGLEDLAALQGLTAIEGNLSIAFKMVDTLGCLESVSGDVSVNVIEGVGDTSLWGLRHLESIGGDLKLSNAVGRTYADCGLSLLERVGSLGAGSIDAKDLGGELDLSRLQTARKLAISNTELLQIKLPASGALVLAQLEVSNNPYLSQIGGFDEVMLQLPEASSSEVRIVNNPRLSECVVDKIGAQFVRSGAAASALTKFGNLPCLEQ